MFENLYFTDETLVNSEFHLNDVDVQISKNYTTKFDKFHKPVERVLKSIDMQIIGFNRDTKMTVTIEGISKISVVEDEYINMSSEI
jgi:hypothetical protein